MSTEETGVVRYTVKELLSRLDEKMDNLSNKIDDRFNDHEARLRKLEDESVTDDALANAKKGFRTSVYKSVGAGVGILGAVSAAANYFLGG